MRDDDADDELPPVIGERYRDVLVERAIALLDDYAPEPSRTRSAGRARLGIQPAPETLRGPHDEN